MKVEGIDHVALVVRDVERSIRWYGDVLGLERRYADVWGDVPAFIGAGTTALALFPVRDGEAKPRPGRDTIAMLHLAFRVDAAGFERAKEELTRRGIAWEFQDHEVSHSIYFEDPDGHQLEITTYDLTGVITARPLRRGRPPLAQQLGDLAPLRAAVAQVVVEEDREQDGLRRRRARRRRRAAGIEHAGQRQRVLERAGLRRHRRQQRPADQRAGARPRQRGDERVAPRRSPHEPQQRDDGARREQVLGREATHVVERELTLGDADLVGEERLQSFDAVVVAAFAGAHQRHLQHQHLGGPVGALAQDRHHDVRERRREEARDDRLRRRRPRLRRRRRRIAAGRGVSVATRTVPVSSTPARRR